MESAETGPGRDTHENLPYTEVWNDAVDLQHLAASLVIGMVGGLPLFLISRSLLRGSLDTPALADGYALLAGLAGCLAAGAICARLFPPKRVFAEDDEASALLRREALAELTEDRDTTTSDQLPEPVRAELLGLGLLEAPKAVTTEAAGPSRAGAVRR